MSTRSEVIIGFCGLFALVVMVWMGIAYFNYQKDSPARQYVEGQGLVAVTTENGVVLSTTTQVVVQGQPQVVYRDNGMSAWDLYWYGYMFGWWGNGYSQYRQVTNNTYYTSPTYTAVKATEDAKWAEEQASWGADKASSWSNSGSGSWGSDDSSNSWSSSGSGSWGGSSDSSWSSGDSGSWGGSDSWSSSGSGSWGD